MAFREGIVPSVRIFWCSGQQNCVNLWWCYAILWAIFLSARKSNYWESSSQKIPSCTQVVCSLPLTSFCWKLPHYSAWLEDFNGMSCSRRSLPTHIGISRKDKHYLKSYYQPALKCPQVQCSASVVSREGLCCCTDVPEVSGGPGSAGLPVLLQTTGGKRHAREHSLKWPARVWSCDFSACVSSSWITILKTW